MGSAFQAESHRPKLPPHDAATDHRRRRDHAGADHAAAAPRRTLAHVVMPQAVNTAVRAQSVGRALGERTTLQLHVRPEAAQRCRNCINRRARHTMPDIPRLRGVSPRCQEHSRPGRPGGPVRLRIPLCPPALYRRLVPSQIGSLKASKGRHMTVPGIGKKAPAFALPRDGGGTVSLSDFAGQKLVLYFYPAPIPPVAPPRRSPSTGCARPSARRIRPSSGSRPIP